MVGFPKSGHIYPVVGNVAKLIWLYQTQTQPTGYDPSMACTKICISNIVMPYLVSLFYIGSHKLDHIRHGN